MKTVKVKTPAKINLTLEILGKRDDGYHNIESVMQAVSLFDILTITVDNSDSYNNSIEITGNNPIIPYDSSNLVYKSADKFLEKTGISEAIISIDIEKNIPVSAGLAGGSSNAAGALYGLNKLFDNVLDDSDLSELASQIGADVNFCLHGGTQFATSKGEKLNRINTPVLNLLVIKPKDIFISAKEAYDKYSALEKKPKYQPSELIVNAINENSLQNIALLLDNNLEEAILPDYPLITDIKHKLIENGCLNAIMSGSGPSVFCIYIKPVELSDFTDDLDIFEVTSIEDGVTII